jgi:excinuclease ABC subunit A
MPGTIEIHGARQNNLQGVSVTLPRDSLVVVTGVSGSGKSSLAFDTLFREGQRRFLETLSAYARQFLGRMEKPDVDSIVGLAPAIAVDQKTQSRSSRSTVGTLTEIFDHLRVLYARAGVAHCVACGLPLESQTAEGIVQQLLAQHAGRATTLLAPVIRDRKGNHTAVLDDLKRRGFVRARVDGTVLRIEEAPELERYKRHSIEVVIDRLKPDSANPGRLREAVEQALLHGGGELVAVFEDGERGFSTSRACRKCGAESPPLEPRLFSFNSPHGACERCEGLGLLRRPSESRVVTDPALSIRGGVLAVTRKSGGALLYPKVKFDFLEQVAEAHGFDLETPWQELSKDARKVILRGSGDERFEDTASWNGKKFQGSVRWQRRFKGVLTALEEAFAGGVRHVERYLATSVCPDCEGTRLNRAARSVRVGGKTLAELINAPVRELRPRLEEMVLTPREARIARDLLAEVRRRAAFLEHVGLDYLTLARAADTLSGGEAQRIRLAAQLGAGLQGVLYVLDEPSIGLHARDHERLLSALLCLRDRGNTVVVVEHDEATLRAADWVVDVGPLAGRRGGRVVAQGVPSSIAAADSPTGQLLRGELHLPAPSERRAGNGKWIEIRGARGFNLKGIDVRLPLGTLIAVSGVSGSGKSTLVNRILVPALEARLGREGPQALEHDKIVGLAHVGDLVVIDAAPIGRTPRSNPATYTDVLTSIRDLFASLPEAQMRGYDKSRFSFNVEGGRCEACGGAGAQLVELQFLAPVTVPCEECGGERFQAETLEVRYAGKSIADVLALTVDEALELFRDHPRIAGPLEALRDVGLDYLTLGQPSTTLSGGEAQRIKLVSELKRTPRAHTLYVLDEPTTGLHQFDVQKLVGALQRLVDAGHTVVVIEHNLEVIRAADHVVDLGPEGGAAGGLVLATGTPEEIVRLGRMGRSHTGRALAGLDLLRESARKGPGKLAAPSGDELPRESASDHIRVVGARTHNLQGIDVEIPRNALTVITGPSGSGKSSLALDTIYTEGKRRFVESLSTYARQFLGSRDKPPVERIDGLGPSVAVEAGTSRGHPRSTIATTTEIHDHLRVLFARAASVRCPEHLVELAATDPGAIAKRVQKALAGQRGFVLAPVAPLRGESEEARRANFTAAVGAWRKAGFLRILVDGAEVRLDGELPLPAEGARLDLVIDRLSFESGTRARVADAVAQAASVSAGRVSVQTAGRGEPTRLEFSTQGACPSCGFHLEHRLDPRHFSFNTHAGACVDCDGLGSKSQCDGELLVNHPEESLLDGAIGGKLQRYLVRGKGYYEHLLLAVAKAHRIDLARPFSKLGLAQQALLLSGEGTKPVYHVEIEKNFANAEVQERFSAPWPGLCGHVDAWHAKAEDPEWAAVLETVMTRRTCPTCRGERLRPEARFALLDGRRLPEVLALDVSASLLWVRRLRGLERVARSVDNVLGELESRLSLLERVGLGYLTLDRATSTLSGGEARRVRLSASLGSQLTGVCYVLDEPTVGLHPADTARLTEALLELRDGGNTVIVVEHDESLMRRADWIVDLGPGSGRLGGRVIESGTPEQVRQSERSLTGKALRGEIRLAAPRSPNAPGAPAAMGAPGGLEFSISGARLHNLKDVELRAAFGELTGVCGPSGSGKSTLILDCLVPALQGEAAAGRWKRFSTPLGERPRLVVIDASPIGRSPGSIPATYTGLMDPLRELFARTPDARVRGFGPAHFSFNSTKGRCQACEGRGATQVEMQFLADLWLPCEECGGRRFTPEVLEVKFRGKSIADVLDLTVDEARVFLEHQPEAEKVLATLAAVGLGYLPLGQSATTLSGGEAQRIKLASELQLGESTGRSVLVLDEPSTGLHASDVAQLAGVLQRLRDRGHAVIVIEHHTGLLAICDRLVELGPGGGAEGGRIVAQGTPEELSRMAASITGPWLAPELARESLPVAGGGSSAPAAPRRARPPSRRRVVT